MDIKIYIGGHQATTTHFLDALEANKNALESEGIMYISPDDDTYISIFKASKTIRRGGDITLIRKKLLQKLKIPQNIKTLIFVDNRIIGTNYRAFEKELFYPRPGGLIIQAQNIFKMHDIRIFVETRTLATLIPSCYSNRILDNISSSLEEFLATINAEDLRWSAYIERAQGRKSPIPATAWRYEDYPYIWRDVIGAITGIPKYQDLLNAATPLDFSDNLQMALLLYVYTQKYPVKTDGEFKKLKELFLEHNPATSRKIATPDWSAKRIEALTNSYNDDWYYIERMENVETIRPRTLTH